MFKIFNFSFKFHSELFGFTCWFRFLLTFCISYCFSCFCLLYLSMFAWFTLEEILFGQIKMQIKFVFNSRNVNPDDT